VLLSQVGLASLIKVTLAYLHADTKFVATGALTQQFSWCVDVTMDGNTDHARRCTCVQDVVDARKDDSHGVRQPVHCGNPRIVGLLAQHTTPRP
jgi:hypothetical protein